MAEPPTSQQRPLDIATAIQQAIAFHARGRLEEAERLYQDVLSAQSDQFDALHFLGILRAQQGNTEAALELLRLALKTNPLSADAHSNLGNVLGQLGRHEEAVASYDRALAIRPEFPDALYNRGNALQAQNRLDEALDSYDHVIALQRDNVRALANRGNILQQLQRYDDAIASYDRVLALLPDDVMALRGRGAVLYKTGRYDGALAIYDRIVALEPASAQAHYDRGDVLQELQRYHEAIACYDRALALQPDFPDALNNRADALLNVKRPGEAARDCAQLLRLKPDFAFAKGQLLYAKMAACEWEGLEPLAKSIREDLRAGKKAAEPFGYQAISTSVRDLRLCAEIYARDRYPGSGATLWNGERYDNGKIRIGYVSGEFRSQATSILMVELFELHDKARFELFAFDNGWDDASDIRGRINEAFDEIVNIGALSDFDAAAAARARRIDILVNLNGYFGRARGGVFAHRPCPVQVNYLGFPGTLGAEYIDYILADRYLISPQDQPCYTEKVVYLPDSYQANDSKRRIAERTPTRAECGLPENGFVYCSFNNNYKITPDIFDAWMRLLGRVGGSTLWLLEDNDTALRNLRREAQARGIGPERLVFAPRKTLGEHLARHRIADLFLDTLPYNAHTTASDALWAGLPFLTCQGTTFPGRVGTSLLHAVGLPELVTQSLEEYETLALKLATNPAMLAGIRAKLARNRTVTPLFDTVRFRRHIESAYVTMWERSQRGEPPASFAV